MEIDSGWLKYYSHVSDYVEIDSSFYRIPSVFMVENWAKKTHKDFKFTAKFPRIITHDKRLEDVDKELDQFFEAIAPLSVKTVPFSQDWLFSFSCLLRCKYLKA